jgi:hypothetical protein
MATIATVIPDPVKQFTDKKGVPLAAGKLYAFDAGSNPPVPRPTYANAALTIPNTHPVVLDLAGRATIFMDQAMYRFVLHNALDQLQWDQDNVPGSVWPGMVQGFSVRTPLPNTNSYGHRFAATINRAPSGTHSLFTAAYFLPPDITGSGATVVEAATVVIAGAPTGATTNYALFVGAGVSRFDGPIRFGEGQVTVGTGAVATLGKVGGGGPVNPAQVGWQRVQTVTGAFVFFPFWA